MIVPVMQARGHLCPPAHEVTALASSSYRKAVRARLRIATRADADLDVDPVSAAERDRADSITGA